MATAAPPAPLAPSPAQPSALRPAQQHASVRPRTFDRQFWLALLLVVTVLVPRSLLIARAHSESIDDDYHLTRGLAFWTRTLTAKEFDLNDPPLAEALIALPMLVSNLAEGRAADDHLTYDQPGRAEVLAERTALGNVVLALPLFGLAFVWCRSVYGTWSGWLAVALLLVDPTFTALIPIPILDILGVEGIVLACFLTWRYFETPTIARLVACGAGIGFALVLKHTAVVLPLVVAALAGLHWVWKPWHERQTWSAWRAALVGRVRALALLGLIVPMTIWALTLFDVSPAVLPSTQALAPKTPATGVRALWVKAKESFRLTEPWPAGCYVRAFHAGFAHGRGGHPGYLFGEKRHTGWKYYYPAVATYKVPIGIGVVLLLGLASLAWERPRWSEWGLMVPCLVWSAFMMNSKINIGFRHFLPAYVFLLMLASRCLAARGRGWSIVAWTALAAAGLHVSTYHPDYLCYVNFPRHKPYLAVNDSNVDWGQSLKQVRAWIDAHPEVKNRPVGLSYFGSSQQPNINYYLGDRVQEYTDRDPPPTTGLLIISPVQEAGVYDKREAYAALQPREPIAVIGHSMLVYDLDALGGGKPFDWTTTSPTDSH